MLLLAAPHPALATARPQHFTVRTALSPDKDSIRQVGQIVSVAVEYAAHCLRDVPALDSANQVEADRSICLCGRLGNRSDRLVQRLALWAVVNVHGVSLG